MMLVSPLMNTAWRAIENAPKDGTHILLTDGKFVGTGAWRERNNGKFRWDSDGEQFGWDIDGEQGDTCPWANDYMGDVIGWMPLPAANLGEAGVSDIEITPEMIEAGAVVLMDQCDLLRSTAASIARVVFQEMIRSARPNPSV